VSQPTIYSVVDAWRSYRADLNDYQESASSSDFASNNNPPWRQALQRELNRGQQSSSFRPQAPAFQPGQRLVNGYQPHSNYRIDKNSRYNSSFSQQRTFTTAAVDEAIKSIETDEILPRNSQPPRKQSDRGPTPRREPTPINTAVAPVPIPVPTTSYLQRAQEPSTSTDKPRALLVLLDLNGTLVYRHGAQRQYSIKRPGVDGLLEYLFSHHAVVLFTSATTRSAEKMAHQLLTPEQYDKLISVRAREHLGLSMEQFRNKVQVYKDLEKIWTVPEIAASAHRFATRWNTTNTILIDDSAEKARSHPHNLLQVPEFMHPAAGPDKVQQDSEWQTTETLIMSGVQSKLEQLKHCTNVAAEIRQWQEQEKVAPGATSESVDSDKLRTNKEAAVETDEALPTIEEQTDYPTPTSLRRGSSSAGNEDEDDYDPDQWKGVRLPTPPTETGVVAAAEASITKQEIKKARKKEKKMAKKLAKKAEQALTMRSPSPVTAEDFSWRTEEKKDVAQTTEI
jgi:Ni/Co efflux regulator RcnB